MSTDNEKYNWVPVEADALSNLAVALQNGLYERLSQISSEPDSDGHIDGKPGYEKEFEHLDAAYKAMQAVQFLISSR